MDLKVQEHTASQGLINSFLHTVRNKSLLLCLQISIIFFCSQFQQCMCNYLVFKFPQCRKDRKWGTRWQHKCPGARFCTMLDESAFKTYSSFQSSIIVSWRMKYRHISCINIVHNKNSLPNTTWIKLSSFNLQGNHCNYKTQHEKDEQKTTIRSKQKPWLVSETTTCNQLD